MDWQEYLQENQGSAVDELLAFIRIPSVSALPTHAPDVAAAGAWVHARLEAAGLEHVQTLPTGGHPVVYADWLHAPDAPTVLIYGHFDVQPAVAEDGWSGPPFEPRLADDRIYARGASDDKGNMFAPIVAVEALLRTRGDAAGQRQVPAGGPGGDRQPATRRLRERQPGAARRATWRCRRTAPNGASGSRRCCCRCAASAPCRWRSAGRRTTCTPACTAAPSRTRCMPWPS